MPEDAAGAFADLVQSVSEEIARGDTKPQWNMEVRQGSRMFVASLVADPLPERMAQETIKAIAEGLFLLQQSAEVQPPYFNQRVLRAPER